MKKSKLVIACICLLFVAFASCKKKHNPSAQDNIVGKWKITEEATDLNGNGVMDANEIHIDTSLSNIIVTFNANGTAITSLSGLPYYSFLWALTNNSTYLKTTDTSSGGAIQFLHIDNLTSSSMTLKDTTGGTVGWEVWTKQ
jgi:hypothetical protein